MDGENRNNINIVGVSRMLGRNAARLVVLYTVVVSTLAEYGENNRFKFAVEPILGPLLLSVAVWMAERLNRAGQPFTISSGEKEKSNGG